MTCKIIHQMWKDSSIPKECVSYVNTWKLNHPGWEYKFWTDASLIELVDSEYSWFADTYNNYDYNICRSDAARNIILHKYGGIYCDIDIENFKPVDILFRDAPVLFCENPDDYNDSILTNSIYYALPGCKFMHMCIKHLALQPPRRLHGEEPNEYVLRATGPRFMSTMYHRWRSVMKIELKSHIHFERHPRRTRVMADSSYVPESDEYGIHRSMGTWVM